MTPYERAKEFYHENPPLSWEGDLEEYMRNGHVHITPSLVLLGCRVDDGWFIRLAVGDGCLAKVVELMPFPLPYVGWARVAKGRPVTRWWPLSRVIELVQYYECNKNSIEDSGGVWIRPTAGV
jgi:hypothetical protein